MGYREIRSIAFMKQEFPYVVELVVPSFGFKYRLDLIEQWLAVRLHRKEFGRWGRWRNQRDIAVWAFRDELTAAEFQTCIEKVMAMSDRKISAMLKTSMHA